MKWAANDTLRGCHGALLMMVTNATQSMQENVKDYLFLGHVKFTIENFVTQALNNTSSLELCWLQLRHSEHLADFSVDCTLLSTHQQGGRKAGRQGGRAGP